LIFAVDPYRGIVNLLEWRRFQSSTENILFLVSFIFTLHLAEKWQRHPAADLRGCKSLLQFTIFGSNKSVNYFYLKMKDA